MVGSWRSGDSIVLNRNRNFREPNRPFLDRIVFKIIPSREVGIGQIRNGDINFVGDGLRDALEPASRRAPRGSRRRWHELRTALG